MRSGHRPRPVRSMSERKKSPGRRRGSRPRARSDPEEVDRLTVVAAGTEVEDVAVTEPRWRRTRGAVEHLDDPWRRDARAANRPRPSPSEAVHAGQVALVHFPRRRRTAHCRSHVVLVAVAVDDSVHGAVAHRAPDRRWLKGSMMRVSARPARGAGFARSRRRSHRTDGAAGRRRSAGRSSWPQSMVTTRTVLSNCQCVAWTDDLRARSGALYLVENRRRTAPTTEEPS